MHYIGWVPTVTGHLSFTTIGSGSFPAVCSRKDVDGTFFILQRRDLLDVLVPYAEGSEVASYFRELLANLVIGISGRFWFVLSAKPSTDGDRCSGQILMIPAANNRNKISKIRDWFKSDNQAGAEDLLRACESVARYSADFELERAGKAEIRPKPDLGTMGEELRLLLANQAFFFLKDISHVHQHHHRTHDAITEVTEFLDSQPDDLWVPQTQFSLYRAIIRYKRFKNEKALFRASGILAYAQSFDKAYGGSNTPAKRFHIEELERSLAVSREEIRHFDQKRLSVIETFRSFFFAAFGLVATAGIFARITGSTEIEVDKTVLWVAQFSAANPVSVLGVTALSALVWAIVTHRTDPADYRMVRLALRLLQGLRLRWTILFNVALTALFAWLAYLLLR